MTLTKKYINDLGKARRATKKGEAYHWPTIAEILLEEIERLEVILERMDGMVERLNNRLEEATNHE